jgi:catechol 2,3-dioxygenase-like lactoylglutathione lyase family enzyme
VLGLVENGHARRHFPVEFRPHELSEPPAGFVIYIEVEDVGEAVMRAVDAGAMQLSRPTARPWGQHSAFLRDPDGVVIELASTPE